MSEITHIDEYWRVVKQKAPHYMESRLDWIRRGALRVEQIYPVETTFQDWALARLQQRFQGDCKGKRLLDVGCGTGRCSLYFAGKGFDVTGLDRSPRALEAAEMAKKQAGVLAGSVAFVEADIFDVSARPDAAKKLVEPFDVLLLYKFLHQIRPSELLILREKMRLLLRPDGLICVGTMSTDHPSCGAGLNVGDNVWDMRGFRPCHFFSQEDVRSFLKDLASVSEGDCHLMKEAWGRWEMDGTTYTPVMVYAIGEKVGRHAG